MAAKLDVRLFFGRGQAGKTYLVQHQLKRLGRGARVLIHDTVAEPGYAQGAHVVETPADLVRLVRDQGGPLRICWRGVATMAQEAFEFANRVAWAAENFTVVWEEVDSFVDAGRLPEWAFRIVNHGRHRGLRVFACARRPARVSRDLTANATRIVAFHTSEPADVEYLRKYVGQAVAVQVAGLGRYECLDWTPAGARVRKSPFR